MEPQANFEPWERQLEVQASQDVVMRLGTLAIAALLALNAMGVGLALVSAMAFDVAAPVALLAFLNGLVFAMLTLAISYVMAQISLASPGFLQGLPFGFFILVMILPPFISFAAFLLGCLKWGVL